MSHASGVAYVTIYSMKSFIRGYQVRKPMEIYDYKENCIVSGEFRSVRELDTGAQLGYFESSEYPNTLIIIVLYADGTYFIAERLEGMLTQGGH